MITHLETAKPYTYVMEGNEVMQISYLTIGYLITKQYPNFIRISRHIAINPECATIARKGESFIATVGGRRYPVARRRRREVTKKMGIPFAGVLDFLVLEALADTAPLTLRALSRRIGRQAAFVKIGVTRLEQRGLIRQQTQNERTYITLSPRQS